MVAEVLARYNYWLYAVLLVIGLYGMMAKGNLMKKLIGMNVLQWAIIFFFISIGAKKKGTVPIVAGLHGHQGPVVAEAIHFVNPLPHVLMLTAIVVGVATTGIALALLIKIHNRWKTLEEDEILKALRAR